jgi:hypothetical protein
MFFCLWSAHRIGCIRIMLRPGRRRKRVSRVALISAALLVAGLLSGGLLLNRSGGKEELAAERGAGDNAGSPTSSMVLKGKLRLCATEACDPDEKAASLGSQGAREGQSQPAATSQEWSGMSVISLCKLSAEPSAADPHPLYSLKPTQAPTPLSTIGPNELNTAYPTTIFTASPEGSVTEVG